MRGARVSTAWRRVIKDRSGMIANRIMPLQMDRANCSTRAAFPAIPTNAPGRPRRIRIEPAMTPGRTNALKLTAAFGLFVLAGLLSWRWMRQESGVSERAFFYDLSEGRLFVANRGLIPPIRGVNDDAEDGVRAVVVSTNGHPENKSTWVIAYLETYAPELKQQLQAAQAAGTPPEISRTAGQSLRLVKRPADPGWVSLATTEGEQVVGEWLNLGTESSPPVICTLPTTWSLWRGGFLRT